jgi:hypothetical protein
LPVSRIDLAAVTRAAGVDTGLAAHDYRKIRKIGELLLF